MNNKTNECLQKINDLIECLKEDAFRSKTQLEKEMDEKTQKQFVEDFIEQAGDKQW